MTTLLKRGSRGAAVRDLQTMLNNQTVVGMPDVLVDGNFGPATEAAVRAFQTAAGLVVDGLVGNHTRTALKQAIAPITPGRPEPDKSAINAPLPEGQLIGEPIAFVPPNAASLRFEATNRFIDEIVWHCAATPEGKDFTVADIRAWHKARGWSDTGYHYIVYRDGRVMLGRPIGQIGAGVAGHNTGKVHAVYIGGVSADGKTPKDTRTEAQRGAMLFVNRQLRARHPQIRRVSGHNDYTTAKACPSFRVGKDPLGRLD